MTTKGKLARHGAYALLLTSTVTLAEPAVIEEVLVTAQKRTENMQDVPASLSVLDDSKLSQLHAVRMVDYAAYIPGFNVSDGGTPGQTSITLRGIAPIGPGSVVGTYINDAPLGSSSNEARATSFALDLMPYDVERVEVLRGPQGTLYGAGAMGGLLKYVLRDPDTSALRMRAGADTSSISGADSLGWGARAEVNAPIVQDQLAVRASFFTQDTPGYIDNALTGEHDENPVEQRGGRVALLWQPREDLSVQLGGMWQRVEADNSATMSLALTALDPPNGAATLGDLRSSHALPQRFEKDVDYYAATVKWELPWAEFVSATSYSKTHTSQLSDSSLTFGELYPLLTEDAVEPGLSTFSLVLDLDKWTQEFRLSSTSDGPLEWLFGAFYTKEESRNVQEVLALDLQRQPIAELSPYLAFASLPTAYREIAAFGDLTWHLTEQFDVTAGVRWAQNKQSFKQITDGIILPAETTLGDSSEDVVTYMLSPRLHLTEDTMLYARVASGYRPGGPNVSMPGVPPQVDADKLINYEAGIKSQLFDARALLNLAVFYIDWQDIQQRQTFGGVSALSNAGNAESRGVELESALQATDNLRLGLNLAYTDATLKSNPPDLDNALGVQLPGVPEWSGSVTLDYSFSLAGYVAHAGGGYRHVGERQSAIVTYSNNLSYVLPSYQTLDLHADVTIDRLTIRLFANNVTDERGYTGGGTERVR
jgi:iron complex outermembrane receptor protein